MRKFTIISFFSGAITAATILFSIYFVYQERSNESKASSILDFILTEWTSPNDTAQIQYAQIQKQIEFTVGVIPDTVRSLALLVEQQYGVPRGVTLSQFILESKWGLNNLGVNNFFGHTAAATKMYAQNQQPVKRYDRMAQKWLLFTSYTSIEEAFRAHGQYLSQSPLYKTAFVQSSPEAFAREIAKYYATDKDYAVKIISIMRRYNLND